MDRYDFIFGGLGMSAMLTIHEFQAAGLLAGKKILILEKDPDLTDKFWCFWEQGAGKFDKLLHAKWSKGIVSVGLQFTEVLGEMTYKCIRSATLMQATMQLLALENCTFRCETVTHWQDEHTGVKVVTDSHSYSGSYLFNSVQPSGKINEKVLLQHFEGWVVKTAAGSFKADQAMLMDFSVPQNGNTRFMYVLPFSDDTALVEYTLFSPELIPKAEYGVAITSYLRERNIPNFEVLSKETGIVPMTAHRFWHANSTNIINIGTAGGWTKASSGYTFLKAQKLAGKLAQTMTQARIDFTNFYHPDRFSWYDRLLIDVLFDDNQLGKSLFTQMFSRTKPGVMMRFLAEQTSLLDEIPILWACPKRPFLVSLLRTL